ncbi:hypothetical protein KY284_030206 [Solanum tuberosum]|nr:hypothetical protein KY284_030206 [Solanum tuberosum]
MEHDIWWQIKGGGMSFWFDNWTKQGALYYIEEQGRGDEEIEVKNFIRNGEWDRQKLRELISAEMTEYIVESIAPNFEEGAVDKPWWMGNSSGEFTVKSAYDCVRHKKAEDWWWRCIWSKGVPFKINFLLWRTWKKRIATEDNLKKMRISIASRCYCCESHDQESIAHLFLTAPIAQKLWKQFASCAGVQIEEGLQHTITQWWRASHKPKLRAIFQVVPAILMWELWKRRNARRHGRNVTYEQLMQQCQKGIFQLLKVLYPWIDIPTDWKGVVEVLTKYKPKLYHHRVTWEKPQLGWLKCNTDGASRGNPRESSYSFCLRDNHGDLIYAEAQKIGQSTCMQAEIMAILKALTYCANNDITNVVVESDSLSLTRMINKDWKIPWEYTKEIEEIHILQGTTHAIIVHGYREVNQLADTMANEAFMQQEGIKWNNFNQLTVDCKRIINMDKIGMPTLRIKTRRISVQRQQNEQ